MKFFINESDFIDDSTLHLRSGGSIEFKDTVKSFVNPNPIK